MASFTTATTGLAIVISVGISTVGKLFKNPTNAIGIASWLAHAVLVGGAIYMNSSPKLSGYAPILVAVAGQIPPVIGPGVNP